MRTESDQDRVKSLCVKIVGKIAREENDVDRALQIILERLDAPEGELKLTSDEASRKLLDDSKEDVRHTVDMLIENQYRMKIGFEKTGTVEYGRDTEAIYGVDDSIFKEFIEGSLFKEKALVSWLDTVIPEDSSHKYIESEKKGHNVRKRSK